MTTVHILTPREVQRQRRVNGLVTSPRASARRAVMKQAASAAMASQYGHARAFQTNTQTFDTTDTLVRPVLWGTGTDTVIVGSGLSLYTITGSTYGFEITDNTTRFMVTCSVTLTNSAGTGRATYRLMLASDEPVLAGRNPSTLKNHSHESVSCLFDHDDASEHQTLSATTSVLTSGSADEHYISAWIGAVASGGLSGTGHAVLVSGADMTCWSL